MARGEPDSATSDFFICIGEQPSLDFGGNRNPDGQGFAAFGRVVRGMEIARRIQAAPSDSQQRLTPPIHILRIARQYAMNILLFGATGMVGDGVLRWLVTAPEVTRIARKFSRRPLAFQHVKVETIVELDMFHLRHLYLRCARHGSSTLASSVRARLQSEATPEVYRNLTFDLTLAVAGQLLPRNPGMVFEYISGEGTDRQSHRGWSRVKAETEDAILAAGFRDAYAAPRPGFIQPMRGAVSREKWARRFYSVTAPFYPVIRALFGKILSPTPTGSPKPCSNSR